jgi:hypothetical protein
MIYAKIVVCELLMVGFCVLGVFLYLRKNYPVPAQIDVTPDEHADCNCVGCQSGGFECNPQMSQVDIAKQVVLPHNIIYVIIEMLQGTKQPLEAALKDLGYSSTEDLSLAQLLILDDKLYRCNVCDYWSPHSKPIYTSLWKCPHCNTQT